MIVNPTRNKYASYKPPDESNHWTNDDGKWHCTVYPVITVQCESFEEFVKWQRKPGVIMSTQPNPWYVSLMYNGICADCDGPVLLPVEGDYLCGDCRKRVFANSE